MSMGMGRLISISGIDGSGKSSQMALLRTSLEGQGYKCAWRLFDATSYGENAAAAISQLQVEGVHCLFTRASIDWTERYPLMRDFVYDPNLQSSELALAVTSVFAGACIQVQACCIRPLLESGIHVFCDRYWYDDLIYRSYWVDEGLIRQLYAPMRTPDLALMIDVPPAITLRRNLGRLDGKSPLLRDAGAVTDLRSRFL